MVDVKLHVKGKLLYDAFMSINSICENESNVFLFAFPFTN